MADKCNSLGCFGDCTVGDSHKIYISDLEQGRLSLCFRLEDNNWSKTCENYRMSSQLGFCLWWSGRHSRWISSLLDSCGISMIVCYVTSAWQTNPTCWSCFRKHSTKSPQIASMIWKLGFECCKWTIIWQ